MRGTLTMGSIDSYSPGSYSPRGSGGGGFSWAQWERQVAVSKMEEFITKTLTESLRKLPQEDPLVAFFSTLLTSDILVDKRCVIARAISKITETRELEDPGVRAEVIAELKEDIFNQESPLYLALNYQRSLFSITFFGRISFLSCNFAKSLQAAQSIILEERKQRAAGTGRLLEMGRIS